MLKQLLRKKSVPANPSHDGWLDPLSGGRLLDQPYRQQMVKAIWDLTSLTKPVFRSFIETPLERYAELVQRLPASESHHHAYVGGMLDHSLEVVNYALRIRQKYLLPPGATPEAQSAASERWTVAVVYGALLHDIAKLFDVDIHIQNGGVWRIWHGPIPGPYRFRYRQGRDYLLHQASGGVLCHRILDPNIMDWLFEDSDVFKQLMFTMAGYEHESGVIGDIVMQADRASVASNLGGDPGRALQAPVESLQRKLVDGLRYLVKEQLTINAPRAPAYLTEDALWIVAPSVPNQLKAYLLSHGVTGVPSNTTRMYDEMQAHGLIEEAAEGKSVWKADVQINEWQATLSFLKVPVSLVWSASDDRPPALNGTITIKQSKQSDKDVGGDQQVSARSGQEDGQVDAPSKAKTVGSEKPQAEHSTSGTLPAKPAKPSEAGSSNDFDIDDMVSLITGDAPQSSSPEPSEQAINVNEISTSEVSQISVHKQPVGNDSSVEPDDLGRQFFQWLSDGLESNKLIVNDAKALVHVVDGSYFLVSPGVFKRFCNLTFGSEKSWTKVQQRFQKLHLHLKTSAGVNIWEATVRGPNRKGSVLKGYRLKPESLSPRNNDNVFLSLIGDDKDE